MQRKVFVIEWKLILMMAQGSVPEHRRLLALSYPIE
jgi:hypothetical protein